MRSEFLQGLSADIITIKTNHKTMANYKLLKSLPGIEAGDIRSEGEWKEETNRNPKDYPDWFGEIKAEWPKSWYELREIKGYYIGLASSIVPSIGDEEMKTFASNRNIFQTAAHSESALAFAQLSQIAKRMNDGFAKDWSNSRSACWTIFRHANKLIIGDFNQSFCHIYFATEEMAEFSLKNHRELWEKYWMI